MNLDEFAFFNQQLATMLREGLPLEGAIRQLCIGMRTGPLRTEIEALEGDLRNGTPLPEAIARSRLPAFYLRMIELGVRSNDLPGVLTLLADHYQRSQALWSRLKGLLVYPLIVIVVSLGLTLLLSVTASHFLNGFNATGFWGNTTQPAMYLVALWVPPVALALLAALLVLALSVPRWRHQLRWRLPGFREASLAQLASSMALMLKQGTPLAEALTLAQALEALTPAGNTLANWRDRVAKGEGKPSQWTTSDTVFPPLFLWVVQRSGEDVAAGFTKAAEIYQTRASHRIELALYGALPISILLLGQMVFWQVAPMIRSLTAMMNALGSFGD